MGKAITIKTPGKLMVAGEFAVLEPHHQLIVMAVDRYLSTTICDNDINEVHLEDFKLYNQRFHFNGEQVVFEKEGPAIRFVKGALTTVFQYLQEKGIQPTSFSLSIQSELDDQVTGQKYGLGSSAAVVTSVVTAVLAKFLRRKPDQELIFKLAAISHVKTQGNGSGADIAASTYGGVIQYASFQAEWLLEQMEKAKNLRELLNKKWTYLSIQRTQFPDNIQLCVGWTGKPASTKSLVSEIRKLKTSKLEQYKTFLENSEKAVQQIVRGMKTNDIQLFYTGVNQNRLALREVGIQANVEIETKKLHTLSNEAKRLGGAGKLSGAGGGDCGIAFVHHGQAASQLERVWQQKGIKPLKIKVSPHGSEIKKSKK